MGIASEQRTLESNERAKLAERAKHMFPGVQRAVENWRWLRGEVGVEGLSL